jgi:hypothetical protein
MLFAKIKRERQNTIDKLRLEEAELRNSVAELKTKHLQEHLELERVGASQMAAFEHEFHSGMEQRKVILAKLDAEIEHKRELVALHKTMTDALLAEKDKSIATLTEMVKTLSYQMAQMAHVEKKQ